MQSGRVVWHCQAMQLTRLLSCRRSLSVLATPCWRLFVSGAREVPQANRRQDLIRLFLKWPPHGRCTVQQSLDHIFFGEVMDLAAVLRTLSHEQLGKLVVDSLTSGVPVSSAGILVAGAPPASPRGAKRPLQVDGAGNDADDVSAGKPDMVQDELLATRLQPTLQNKK